MKKYTTGNLPYNESKLLEIPKFQRGLVWSKAKKVALLDTIHKGFPFGSLLVSEETTADGIKLLLLDGQQRLSTIKEYANNRFQYWKQLNRNDYDTLKKNVNDLIGDKNYFVNDDKLNEITQEGYDLAKWTDHLEFLDVDTRQKLRDLVNAAIKSANSYINLDDLTLPIIKYTGEKEYLPEVFENLNSGGVSLSKYEVFNASWNDVYLKLPVNNFTNEILDNVKRYYLELQEAGKFKISEFSEDELSRSRKINLAEFARAFGEFTVSRLFSLFDNKKANKSFCEIGYGLLAIITGIQNAKIMNIQYKKEWIQRNLLYILQNTDSLANNINSIFSKILVQNLSYSIKKNAKKYHYSTGLSSSFKILSYFADLWDAESPHKDEILRNIPAYYIYDSLNETWTGHGDSRLNDFYPGVHRRTYSENISEDEFNRAFDAWVDENPRNRKTFSKEIKALITIHSNLTYMSGSIPSGGDYEFEHIIPKEWMVDKNNTSQPTHLSSLGNGMFLPKDVNNKKKGNTLYQWKNYDPEKYKDLIKESLYPDHNDFDRIKMYINSKNYEEINDFIDKRAKKVGKVIVHHFYK